MRGSLSKPLFGEVRPSDLLVLVVPCVVPVLDLLATNPIGVPHAERLFAVAALLWLVVASLAVLAITWGAHRVSTILVALVATWVVANGGGFIDGFGYLLGLLLAGVLLLGIGLLAFRLRDTPVASILIYGILMFLAAGPAIVVASSILSPKAVSTRTATELLQVDLGEERPDVWLVVLDGHPGLRAMEQDFEPGASDAFAMRLRGAGYQMPESAWSSYWVTDFSLPSILEMTYPVSSISKDEATIQDLYEVVAGDNRLVNGLQRNGYTTYMVESGWSGSACGPSFDQCVASHWLDESMFFLLEPSILSNFVVENYGFAFTAGAQTTMQWSLENAPRLGNDEEPSFVFAHVMAPHPPFFINADCEVVYEVARTGVAFQEAAVSEDLRQTYLEDQMACVEDFMIELVDAVGEKSIVVVVSDHGTDRRDQLVRAADTWTANDIVERMNSLVAVAGLDQCPFREPVVLPNVMLRVLSCLSGDHLDAAEAELHLGPGHQLTGSDLEHFQRHRSRRFEPKTTAASRWRPISWLRTRADR